MKLTLVAPLALAALVALVPAVRSSRAQDEPTPGEEKKPEDAPAGGNPDDKKKPDAKKGDDGKKKDDGAKKDEGKGDEPKKDEAKEPTDLESLAAKSLAAKLHVPPNWKAKEGTVDLLYAFHEEPQLLDWKIQGADKAEISGGLELGVGSAGTAFALLSPIELKGDFEVEVALQLLHMGPSSDFAFVVGQHGNDAIGIRYGDQYVKIHNGKLTPITNNQPSQDKFAIQKAVDLKIVRKGDELQTWINKMERPKKRFTKKELDGKIGFMIATNVRMKLTSVHVTGVIDKSKL